ncbi:MAG: carbohydrate ABC transporter permease [Candidatus Sumerlaeia bacterium]|nr:carbohydrate ABC transporter permease [Candidatus Sumerlaeia bacterium]
MSPRNTLLLKIRRVLFYMVLIFALVYTIFPVWWALVTSLKPPSEIAVTPVTYLPENPTLSSFQAVLRSSTFQAGLRNSMIVAAGATVLSLLLGSLAACALGRYRFRGRGLMMALILSMTMFPQIAVVGSLYRMISLSGLYNTQLALILTYLLTTLPFTVWVLSTFFRALPKELEESATVDGASPLQTFWLILLPLAMPGMITTGLLAMITSWNEYLFALSFTIDERARTVPVVVAQFRGASRFEIPWGEIMAGSLIATAPLLLIVFLFQRRIVAGLTSGAVKE